MDKIQITRTQLKELYNVACPSWKVLIDKLASNNKFDDFILIEWNIVQLAYRQADISQKQTLRDVFGSETFKPKLAEKWEDLKEVDGYYIDNDSTIVRYGSNVPVRGNTNTFATEKQAKSALAMAQLSQLMKQVNGDWVADWNDVYQNKYVIYSLGDRLEVATYTNVHRFLAFRDAEIRNKFLKNHEQLIKEYHEFI